MDLEDGALVPATGSVVPTGSASAAMPAGPNHGIFHQPVQAYCQFAQNNLTDINEGNIGLFRQEAEERHSQIMEQMVQQLCQDYESWSLKIQFVLVMLGCDNPVRGFLVSTHAAHTLVFFGWTVSKYQMCLDPLVCSHRSCTNIRRCSTGVQRSTLWQSSIRKVSVSGNW